MAIDNPADYLRRYIETRFKGDHRFASLSVSSTDGSGAEAYCRTGDGVCFRLFIPRDAPADARPLCTEVRKNIMPFGETNAPMVWRRGHALWSFDEDYRQFVGFGSKVRIHLHMYLGVHCLVHVEEGRPDTVYRVSKVNDENFPENIELLLKAQVATLWGYTPKFDEREKRVLADLRRQAKKL